MKASLDKPPWNRPPFRRIILTLVLAVVSLILFRGIETGVDFLLRGPIREPGDHAQFVHVSHYKPEAEFVGRGDKLIVWDWCKEDGDTVRIAGQDVELRNNPMTIIGELI